MNKRNFHSRPDLFRNKFYWQVRRMLTNAPQTVVRYVRRKSDLTMKPVEKLTANYGASLGG